MGGSGMPEGIPGGLPGGMPVGSIDVLTPMILILTIVPIVFGAILGVLRCRNRAITRFVLVVLSAVLAFFLKDVFIDRIFGIQIEGKNLDVYIISQLSTNEEIPTFFINLLLSLIKVIISLVCFIGIFNVLSFFTWIIVFSILKLIIKKEEKRHHIIGLLVGALQGVLVAFVICAPITGAVAQVNKIAQMKINGQSLIESEGDSALDKYINSPLGVIYTKTGSWLFNAITTYTDSYGNNVTLEDTIQAADTGVKVIEEIGKISGSLSKLDNLDEGTTKSDVLRDVAGSLSSMGETISATSDGGKQVLQELINSVGEIVGGEEGGGEEGGGSEITEIVNKIDVENIKLESAAEAIIGVADYLDKQEGKVEEIPEDTIETIVNGFAENMVVVEMIPEDTPLIELPAEDKQKFEDAIEKVENISESDKEKLMAIFGLNK